MRGVQVKPIEVIQAEEESLKSQFSSQVNDIKEYVRTRFKPKK